jgi:hypothetical protein
VEDDRPPHRSHPAHGEKVEDAPRNAALAGSQLWSTKKK